MVGPQPDLFLMDKRLRGRTLSPERQRGAWDLREDLGTKVVLGENVIHSESFLFGGAIIQLKKKRRNLEITLRIWITSSSRAGSWNLLIPEVWELSLV